MDDENITLWNCEAYTQPSSMEIIENIIHAGKAKMATMFSLFGVLAITIVLFIDVSIFRFRHAVNWKRTKCSIWFLSIFPVLMSFAVMGLFMPRTLGIAKFCIVFYFAVGLKNFFHLMLDYYGGRRRLVEAFNEQPVVSANPFPCCFICCCCNQPMTNHRVKILEGTVNQVVYIYPVCYFIQTVLAAEISPPTANLSLAFFVFEFIVAFSSLTCLYGCVVIAKASLVSLQQFRLRGKYICIQLLLLFITLQDVTLDILQGANVIPCSFPYPNRKRAFVLQLYLLVFELFVIGVIAWYMFRHPDDESEVEPSSALYSTDSKVAQKIREEEEYERKKKHSIDKYDFSDPPYYINKTLTSSITSL
ncbi:organic solute transporter subunit alpha-like [Clavelina lepadiformis]|uniref:organic solute transporter subunit alpha-like n=1 Tax=Clavelina lepadiformis TaxID=159417 RepID=UPI0040421B09